MSDLIGIAVHCERCAQRMEQAIGSGQRFMCPRCHAIVYIVIVTKVHDAK